MQFFLWLLPKNKILTRDNVGKRKEVEDKTCLFCCEHESVNHLFFECVVAKQIWLHISEVLNIECGSSFSSVGGLWLSKKIL